MTIPVFLHTSSSGRKAFRDHPYGGKWFSFRIRFLLTTLCCVVPSIVVLSNFLLWKENASISYYPELRETTTSSITPKPEEDGTRYLQEEEGENPKVKIQTTSNTFSDTNIPYYLKGRSWDRNIEFDESKIFRSIGKSTIKPIEYLQDGWVLSKRLQNATRNHDSVLIEFEPSGNQILLLVLGRYSRSIQWINLLTGDQGLQQVEGVDPAGNPLNDLNHVYAVVVDSLDGKSKEIWLPCGFHGDKVNKEESSYYARIVDLKTMQITAGPKLPFAGGACVAAAIHVEGREMPPHICSFGGTQGNHDTGNFLPYTSCYDRIREKWHHPFGKLPYGFDHGSLAHIPPNVCNPLDPARILIFNFRTSNYGTQSPVILAFDLPEKWSQEELNHLDFDSPGQWYVFANVSYTGPEDEIHAPRDASGLSLANGGRNLINFGGTHYEYKLIDDGQGGQRQARLHHKFSTIRSFDICTKEWSKIGDLGAKTFAIQSSASSRLNVAISCGGHAFSKKNENIPWCFANKFPSVTFQNDPFSIVSEGMGLETMLW